MRIVAFAHHPIQYLVPLFRGLARKLDGEFKAFFTNVELGNGALDPGFGIPVTWDVPLLEGYKSEAVPKAQPTKLPLVLLNILRRERPDAVLLTGGYTDPVTIEVLLLARTLNVPVVWRMEATDSDYDRRGAKKVIRALGLRALYSLADGFLIIGQNASKHFLKHGVGLELQHSSPYQIDDELFEVQRKHWLPQRNELRAQHGFTENDVVLIYCGKFLPDKDPGLILRAAEQSHHRDQLGVIMLGTGELYANVKADAERVLPGRAILPGFVNQSEMGKYYAMADVGVLPSKHETWGLVLNEAMLFGYPVICTDRTGAAADLVTGRDTGFVFPVGDAAAFARHIDYFIDHPAELKRMGSKARERISHYTTETATQGILNAVSKIVNKNKSGPLSSSARAALELEKT